MSSLSGLPSTFQPVGSPTRANTVPAVSAGINARAGASQNQSFESWFEEYLKQQQQAAAEQKAAEEQAATEQAATEQAAAEEAALNAQKQGYKDAAEFIFEANPIDSGSHQLYKLDGAWSADMFVDVTGKVNATLLGLPFGFNIVTGYGDDVIYMGNNEDYFESATYSQADACQANSGDDKIFAEAGYQAGHGGHGDDLIDLGDGFDCAQGQYGADEFVIDLQNSGYDLIGDFLDVGDKITLFNGGEVAQQDDWNLVPIGNQWTGLDVANNVNLNGVYLEHHNFYELQAADGQVAAIFSAGTMAGSASYSQQQYDLTIQKSASGLEIVAQTTSDDALISFV